MPKSKNVDAMMIFALFVGLIITVTFMVNIGDSISDSTTLTSVTNLSATVPAINTTFSPKVPGRANTTVITIINGTQDFTNNFTVNTSDSNGVLGVFLFPKDAANTENVISGAVNLTYTYEPQGYIPDSGARNVTLLILIMSALAIVVFAVAMLMKGSFGQMMRNFK